MIYYTSDLHLGNKNIIKYENRPYKSVKEMDAALIANWNSRVKPEDDVYVLGDFCFKGVKQTAVYLSMLNGFIHLLRGNHDHFMSQAAFREYARLSRLVENEGHYAYTKDGEHELILCHYPILYWENMEHGSIHLYGHCHTYRDCSKMSPNSYNVGVDVNNYMPVTLEELMKKK